MKSAILLLWGLFLMTLALPGVAQVGPNDQLPDSFWSKFEVGFDRFMRTLFDDFSPNDRFTSVDSAGASPDYIIRTDTTIQAGDTLRGSILVDHATLTVAGILDGDLVVCRGTVTMRSGSRITGDVRMRESIIQREDDALVMGALEQSRNRWSDTFPASDPWLTMHSFRRPMPWMSETWTASPFFLRYNRVEGLFLGLGSAKRYHWDGDHNFSGYGSVGYGFASHRWRGNLGITRQFAFPSAGDGRILEVGIEGYSLTDTRDPWIIGQAENTAAAFFLRQDYRDHFQREGFTAHIAAYYRDTDLYGEAKFAFLADRYASLADNTSWALFGGSRIFRTNPRIDDGRMRSLTATMAVTSALSQAKIPEGWTAFASAEFSDPIALGGEFDFEKYVVEVRRYQPLGVHDRLNVRLRAGTAHGELPLQKSYMIGGLGTIPAFGFATIPGDSMGANRMILFNAEYLVSGEMLHDLSFWPDWLFRRVNFILLADAGFVRAVDPAVAPLSGFGGIRWSDFRSDVGVGISNVSGSVRGAVMWRTDRSETPRLIVRLSRPF